MKQIKTIIILLMMTMTMTVAMSARSPIRLRINGVDFEVFDNHTVVPEDLNVKFLKGVYVGATDDLKDEQIFITSSKVTENYTIAILEVDKDYYVATYKHAGGIIDGAMLLCKDDILLGCDFLNPRGNRMQAESPLFSLEENKVTVERNYLTQVNALEMGGPIITEEGTVTTVYDVDYSGIISKSKDGNTYHSKWTEKENMSVPRPRGDNPMGKVDVTESDRCKTLGPGINIINFYTNPVSKEDTKTPEQLESLKKQFNAFLESPSLSSWQVTDVASRLATLDEKQVGMILRKPQLWLDWLNKNPKSRGMVSLKESLEIDEDLKPQLLEAVKGLKDKKLRKAWQKILK